MEHVSQSDSVLTAREVRPEELEQAGRLRWAYFVEQRGWVEGGPGAVEFDRYDPHALHLGVFEHGRLLAYLRVLTADAPTGLMLDHDFRACLTPGQHAALPRTRLVELSRRVVAPGLTAGQVRMAVELLFMLFHSVARERGFEHVLVVQEPRQRRVLQRCFGIELAPLNAEPYTFEDGTSVTVDVATLASLRAALAATARLERYERFHHARVPPLPPRPSRPSARPSRPSAPRPPRSAPPAFRGVLAEGDRPA
ncbi:MAG: N-acyl amino acid synthase FeeM domain-containing protein [Myxococcota bacterium]